MNDEQHFQLFRKRGALLLKGRKEFIAMIPRIYKNHMYKKKGFGSIYECAAKIGGVSHKMVDEVIRVNEKLKEMPRLREKIAEVGLSKIKTVANIATKQTENEWSQKVTKMTRAALETHIRDIKNSIPGESPTRITHFVDFESFHIKLDPEIILKLQIIKQKMGKGTTWNDVFSQLTDLPQPKPQKNPRPSNPKKRHLATAKRRELKGKCSHHGCNKPAQEIHHKKPWAKFRNHEELEPLCKEHHELEHQSKSNIDKKYKQHKLKFA